MDNVLRNWWVAIVLTVLSCVLMHLIRTFSNLDNVVYKVLWYSKVIGNKVKVLTIAIP